jgi:SAM-dependent methyltransferase
MPSEAAAAVPRPASVCIGCASSRTRAFFELPSLPVQDGLLWETRAEALCAPTGRIRLVFCEACGLIANETFEPEKLRYEQGYDISLHHSPHYREFVRALARRLIETYGLRNKTIVEIACGNGDFLREICRLGDNRGLGFDPSLRPGEADSEGGRLTFVPEFYARKHADRDFDLLACRHLLQSLPEPRAFVDDLARTLAGRTASLYFEMPNAGHIIRDAVIWYIVYEYRSFFTPPALARLFEAAGFSVQSVSTCFDGQYLSLEARAGGAPGMRRSTEDVEEVAREVDSFQNRARRKLAEWEETIARLRESGRKAAVWGAGGRAITFLSVFDAAAEFPRVVDINPRRQGRYLPRTGQRIEDPSRLREDPPDVLLISNPSFEEEIRRQAADLGLDCEYLRLS